MTIEELNSLAQFMPFSFSHHKYMEKGAEKWHISAEAMFGGNWWGCIGSTEQEVLGKAEEWLRSKNFIVRGKKIELNEGKGENK